MAEVASAAVEVRNDRRSIVAAPAPVVYSGSTLRRGVRAARPGFRGLHPGGVLGTRGGGGGRSPRIEWLHELLDEFAALFRRQCRGAVHQRAVLQRRVEGVDRWRLVGVAVEQTNADLL